MDKKTILIVDDAPANIDLLVAMIKGKFKAKVATNGEKALQIAAKEPKPDLILLDVMMPFMNGYEVCRLLKSDPATRRIPVIFVSAKVTSDEQRQGIDMGAVGYITKPVDSGDLMDTIDLVFGGYR